MCRHCWHYLGHQSPHFHPVHWDQIKIIVCQSLGPRPTWVQELFTFVAHLFGTTCRCLSIQPFQLLPSRDIWRHTSLTWPFPRRHRHAQWTVDVTELFFDFAVEHWFGCCTTELGFARDIGAVEIWLIDWLRKKMCTVKQSTWPICTQVTAHGGPQPESTIEFSVDDSTIAEVSGSGMLNASQPGTTILYGRAVGLDEQSQLIIYSQVIHCTGGQWGGMKICEYEAKLVGKLCYVHQWAYAMWCIRWATS